MAIYSLPYFGDLDINNHGDYYRTKFDLDGKQVSLDLNLRSANVEVGRLLLVKRFLENAESYNKNNIEYIKKDYVDEKSDNVAFYVRFHLEEEEMDSNDFLGLIDFSSETMSPELQLVNALKLVRIGFYPDSDRNYFAIFDYSIGQEITNYLVVILTDENGNIVDITVES